MPTTVERKYYYVTYANLNTIPLKEGNVIATYDTDGLYYDVGNPAGSNTNVTRRKTKGFKLVDELPEIGEYEIIYIVLTGDIKHGYIYRNNAFVEIFNTSADENVQSTPKDDTKAYLVASEADEDIIGKLIKNTNIYINTDNTLHADIDGNAETAHTADLAINATNATNAVNATKDSLEQNITGYIRSALSDYSVSETLGSTITFTTGAGNTFDVKTKDTTYDIFDDVTSGLVPDTSTTVNEDTTGLLLTGSGWMDADDIAVGSATTATSATEDSAGNDINATYYSSASFSSADRELTLTKGDGTSDTVTIPGISDADVFTQNSNGLVPAPSGTGDTDKFLKGDGTWDSVPASIYHGADASTAGIPGLVPGALAGEMNKFLRGDGTWGSTFSVGNDGLVPAPTSNDTDKFLQAVSDGQGGITGQWVSTGVDTKNTTGALQVIPNQINEIDFFEGDGINKQFTTSYKLLEVTTITIDDVATSDYTVNAGTNTITLGTAPDNGAIVKISYVTYDYNEVLYITGAKSQDAYPQTFTDSTVYIKANTLYSRGYEVVDTISSQDLYNKTFNGYSLGTAAFRKADDSVTISSVTMSDSFNADGTTADFTTSYSMVSLTSIVVSEVVSSSKSFTGDGTTVEFGLTDTIIAISSVTVEGTATSAYIFDVTHNTVVFDTAPVADAAIVISYTKYQTIATPAYTVNTGTSTISFTVAPDVGDKIDVTYQANDPTYDTSDVPTNQAVISYTNSRISTVQNDLTRRVSIDMVAATYDSTSTYAIGDYCIYNNGDTTDLYVCNTLISSSEPWTSAHWTKVIITDRLDLHHYSNTERVVGTWKDNHVLYEQTITISNITIGSAQDVAHGITADKMFIAEGFTEYSISSDSFFGTISPYAATAGDEQFCVRIGETNIRYVAGTNLAGGTAYLTVRYTKPLA